MFINFSNHLSNNWSENQRQSAEQYGEIIDMPFPHIDPTGTTEYFDNLMEKYTKEIMDIDPEPVVMVQGEFVLTYRVVTYLKSKGIKCVAAQTKREVTETLDEEGQILKTSIFRFEQFMEY